MSDTKYQIFCRYYHSRSNVSVTNMTEVEWKQAETVHTHSGTGEMQPLTSSIKSVPGVENMWIRHEDDFQTTEQDSARRTSAIARMHKNAKALDRALNTIIADETHSDNPKYDMIFVYTGFSPCVGPKRQNTATSSGGDVVDKDESDNPQVYYERMQRIDIKAPWFLYATCASLQAAMTKAEDIIRIMGTSNVMIGKVVDLEEYIEIV